MRCICLARAVHRMTLPPCPTPARGLGVCLRSRGASPRDAVPARPRGSLVSAQLGAAPAAVPANDDEAIREARTARLAPGDGALPLDALLRAVPPDVAL